MGMPRFAHYDVEKILRYREENVVKAVAKLVLLATVAAASAGSGRQPAFAQYTPANTGFWGTEIPSKEARRFLERRHVENLEPSWV